MAYEEEVQELELPHVEEPREEEEGVQFEDAGQSKRGASMECEVAGLDGDLGVYWSQAAPRRLRRSRRSTRAPERIVPTF